MRRMERVDFTPFLICFCNILAGILNVVWLPGEVASPLIIVGGSSAIFFVFFAKSYGLSLLSFFFNNVIVFYVLRVPDPPRIAISNFFIAFFNLKYLDYGLKEMLIHINFLFAGASLIYFSFFSTELQI